jgi:hypothetical protein
MKSASNHEGHAQHLPRQPAWRRSLPIRWTGTTAALLALAVLGAGCGGSARPGIASSGSAKAQFVSYARCMRGHGVSDFPDPTILSGGGVAFELSAGPGSDLNARNPTFEAASHACRALEPGGQRSAPSPISNIAAEVRWARCLRSHGVPSFPDPNSSGAIDSGKFDPSSPAFQRASAACKSVQPTGPVTAVPGPGPGTP